MRKLTFVSTIVVSGQPLPKPPSLAPRVSRLVKTGPGRPAFAGVLEMEGRFFDDHNDRE
jgi:hypothetical protein